MLLELRIQLPLSLDEYQRGSLYMVSKMSRKLSKAGEGVQINKDEACIVEGVHGRYTEKTYHLGSKTPPIIQKITPKGVLTLQEQSWNLYPFTKTKLMSSVFEKFEIEVTTIHSNDLNQQNIHNLTEDDLKQREIFNMDISLVEPDKYDPLEDPCLCTHSRGPLTADWKKSGIQMMVYKLLRVKFDYFGLSSFIESTVIKSQLGMFVTSHRLLYCAFDEWSKFTMSQIRLYERETADLLNNIVSSKNDIVEKELTWEEKRLHNNEIFAKWISSKSNFVVPSILKSGLFSGTLKILISKCSASLAISNTSGLLHLLYLTQFFESYKDSSNNDAILYFLHAYINLPASEYSTLCYELALSLTELIEDAYVMHEDSTSDSSDDSDSEDSTDNQDNDNDWDTRSVKSVNVVSVATGNKKWRWHPLLRTSTETFLPVRYWLFEIRLSSFHPSLFTRINNPFLPTIDRFDCLSPFEFSADTIFTSFDSNMSLPVTIIMKRSTLNDDVQAEVFINAPIPMECIYIRMFGYPDLVELIVLPPTPYALKSNISMNTEGAVSVRSIYRELIERKEEKRIKQASVYSISSSLPLLCKSGSFVLGAFSESSSEFFSFGEIEVPSIVLQDNKTHIFRLGSARLLKISKYPQDEIFHNNSITKLPTILIPFYNNVHDVRAFVAVNSKPSDAAQIELQMQLSCFVHNDVLSTACSALYSSPPIESCDVLSNLVATEESRLDTTLIIGVIYHVLSQCFLIISMSRHYTQDVVKFSFHSVLFLILVISSVQYGYSNILSFILFSLLAWKSYNLAYNWRLQELRGGTKRKELLLNAFCTVDGSTNLKHTDLLESCLEIMSPLLLALFTTYRWCWWMNYNRMFIAVVFIGILWMILPFSYLISIIILSLLLRETRIYAMIRSCARWLYYFFAHPYRKLDIVSISAIDTMKSLY